MKMPALGIMSNKKASSVLTETVLLAFGSSPEQRLNVGLAVTVLFASRGSSQRSSQLLLSYPSVRWQVGHPFEHLAETDHWWCRHSYVDVCWFLVAYDRHRFFNIRSFLLTSTETRKLPETDAVVSEPWVMQEFNVFFRCICIHKNFILYSITMWCVLQ